MDIQNMQLRPAHRVYLERFIKGCEEEGRITAALLVGSYAKGLADKHSDLDLYLIIPDDSYSNFITDRSVFFRQLGAPLFVEDFDLQEVLFLILRMAQRWKFHSDVKASWVRFLTNHIKFFWIR